MSPDGVPDVKMIGSHLDAALNCLVGATAINQVDWEMIGRIRADDLAADCPMATISKRRKRDLKGKSEANVTSNGLLKRLRNVFLPEAYGLASFI